MKQHVRLPRIILAVFLLSLSYWTYLALSTRMDISNDALSYEYLGRLLQSKGLLAYFNPGPNREPVYPLLVALAMHIEYLSGIAYTTIIGCFGVVILLLTQWLSYRLLSLLNVRTWICALILLYLGISPALNNTAFSLYSEISVYLFILWIVLLSYKISQSIDKSPLKSTVYSGILGLVFIGATLAKVVFECIFPLYLLIYAGMLFAAKKKLGNIPYVLAAFILFYIGISGYKWLNYNYNGHYAVTNRASWALYGNTARRMEPLTTKRFTTALAYVPGEGLCISLFGAKECEFWSYRPSDTFGFTKAAELVDQGLSTPVVDKTLLRLAKAKAFANPLQFAGLTAIEGIKMFFWESTQISFVTYPHWLERIYAYHPFKNSLRLLIALLSIFSFSYCWVQLFKNKNPLLGIVLILMSLYISLYSFFFILTRYALPIAPLFLICIGYTWHHLLNRTKNKQCS